MSDVDIRLFLNEAVRLHKADEYQLAHDWYRTVLGHDPNNISALRLLGILLLQHGFHQQGHELARQVLSLCHSDDRKVGDMHAYNFDIAEKYGIESDGIGQICNESGWPDLDMKTTNTWRHLRMLDFAPCFAGEDSSWLTIGDAYGHDSLLLKRYGLRSVVASNLNSACLRLGHAAGAIGDYLEINAESIALPDNSFDYVLCKEAIHHMPRPPLAIYEMLRVARRAVILIEPRDALIDWPAKKDRSFWHHVQDNNISFGHVGADSEISSQLLDWHEDEASNYVYTVSVRELSKLCNGSGLPAFCYKGFNDFYNAEWAVQPAPDSEGFSKTAEQIELWDRLCAQSGKPTAYLAGILFKRPPEQNMVQKLYDRGYTLNRTSTRFLPIRWPT